MCAYCVTFRVLSGTNWVVFLLLHTVCSSQGLFLSHALRGRQTGRQSPDSKEVLLALSWWGRKGLCFLSKVTQLHLSRGLWLSHVVLALQSGAGVSEWQAGYSGSIWFLPKILYLWIEQQIFFSLSGLCVLICGIDIMVFAYKDMAVL